MTVIAWDGRTLAADKLAVQGGICRATIKIVKHRGHLLGGAGPLPSILNMHRWWINGANPAELPVSQRSDDDWCDYLVVHPDKALGRFENSPEIIPILEEVFATGDGAKYAYGAMAAGANAIRAVEIASEYAEMCGGGVDFLRLDDTR